VRAAAPASLQRTVWLALFCVARSADVGGGARFEIVGDLLARHVDACGCRSPIALRDVRRTDRRALTVVASDPTA